MRSIFPRGKDSLNALTNNYLCLTPRSSRRRVATKSQFQYHKNRFIVFLPNKDDVAEAFRRSQSLGIPPSSFTRGVGRMTGFLGEVAFGAYVDEAEYVGEQCYSHDYFFRGKKIDVKSKTCTTKPRLNYVATVNRQESKDPDADIYFFTRVHKDLSKVWLVGWATQYNATKDKNFKKKGSTDNTGFTYLCDGYHMPIRSLRRPDSFLSLRQCRKKNRD